MAKENYLKLYNINKINKALNTEPMKCIVTRNDFQTAEVSHGLLFVLMSYTNII